MLWRSQVSQLSECLSGWDMIGTGWPVAAAELGCVGGPVSGGAALPGDSDGDVDAEHPGEHRRGQVGGELEQRGRARLPGADADLAQALGHLVGADRSSGLAAGEQPGRGALVADGGVTPPGGDDLEDQHVERLGKDDWLAAELDAYLAAAGLDVAEGELADRGWPLGVEQDEQPGDAVFVFDSAVVQLPACLFLACLGVDDTGRPAPPDGREIQAGQLVLAGPADEVPRVGAVAGLRGDQPCLQVALPGGGQGEVVCGEPVEQGDGGFDDPLGGHDLVVGGVPAAQPCSQPTDHVPDGVAVQLLLLARAGALGDDPGDPAFQPAHLLIACREGSDGDQDAAQVLGWLALRELVEGAVAQLLPGQSAQDRRCRAPVQPRFDGGGPLSGHEGGVEGLQAGADVTGLAAQQLTQPLRVGAAGAPAGVDPAGLPAAGAAAPEPGIGARARRAQGLGPGAAADPGDLAAAAAPGPALLACFAPRLAGRLGQVARCVAAADRAGHRRDRRAGRAQRPVRGADADRAAPAAPGADFLVGRVHDQAVRAQRPAVLVADGDLLDGSAPCARLEAGPGDAAAARALPADPPVPIYEAAAPREWRPDNPGGAGVAELADQPQHGWDRRPGARSGEQSGLVLQGRGVLP